MKITNEVLTEYLNCKYKAYLILKGVGPEPSAYERWLKKNEEQYAGAATRALLDRENSCAIVTKLLETSLHLRQGIGLVIGAQAESESLPFSFHALQRVPGASALGPFHYVPVLFSNTGASSDAQKLALSCESLILERLQQVRPRNGILVSGDAYKSRSVDLDERLVADICKHLLPYVLKRAKGNRKIPWLQMVFS